jgi:hypothetical protein
MEHQDLSLKVSHDTAELATDVSRQDVPGQGADEGAGSMDDPVLPVLGCQAGAERP